jgi:hypothetical protein
MQFWRGQGLVVIRQVPVPAVVRGDGGLGFREDRFEDLGEDVDCGVWSNIGVDIGAGTEVGSGFWLAGVGLGVRRPSLNSGNFNGVSMKLLRRRGAASDEMGRRMEVEAVDGARGDDGVGIGCLRDSG